MKGIYLTQEAKQKIEDKVIFLISMGASEQIINKLKEILSSATILPVYESLGHAMQNKDLDNPNGVIIQPKE